MEAIHVAAKGRDSEQIDAEAVAHRARSDPEAFAELYVVHRDAVFRYLRARCASDQPGRVPKQSPARARRVPSGSRRAC